MIPSRRGGRRPMGRERITERGTRRQLLPGPGHARGIAVPVCPQSHRCAPPFLRCRIGSRERCPIGNKSQTSAVNRPVTHRQEAAFAVGIIQIIQFQVFLQGPAARQGGHVLCPERGLLLRGAQAQHQIALGTVVIPPIFQILIVQIIVAQHVSLHMPAGIMAVRSPHRKRLLFNLGQIAQDVVRTLILSGQVRIQLHPVHSGQRHHGQFVVWRQAGLHLELSVNVVRQERQAYHLEKQLQIGLAQGEQIGGLLPDVAAPAQGSLGGSQCRLERLALRTAVAQTEIEHRAHGSGTVGRERTGIELDFAHQIGVDDTHRTSRSPLCGEMVDVGNLNAVHVEAVLRRAAAPHNQVVAIAHG